MASVCVVGREGEEEGKGEDPIEVEVGGLSMEIERR